MPTFTAEVRVVHQEVWTVEADDLADAKDKIDHLNPNVETDDTGGEITDWHINSIRRDN